MPWLLNPPLKADNVERAEQNMFYLCGFSLWFSYLYLSTSLDYSVVELNGNKAQ